VLTQYPTNNFPEVAYPGQLAIDGNQHTLAYYSATGAWQSVPGANGGQSFYQPTAPTSGMNLNDTWYNTANDNQVSFWNGTAWTLVPFGTNAIANTITGTQIQTAANGVRMWMSGQPSAYQSEELISLWYSTGLTPEAPGRVALTWSTNQARLLTALSPANTNTTTIPINGVTGFACPIGSTIILQSQFAGIVQNWITTAPVASGDSSISVQAQTPNGTYPAFNTYVTWSQPVPDVASTETVGIGIYPPEVGYSVARGWVPQIAIVNFIQGHPLVGLCQTSLLSDYIQIQGVETNFSNPTSGIGQLFLSDSGALIGQYSTNPIQGIDFGKVTSVTTSGSGGVLVTHSLGVIPTVVNVTPFMAATNVGWRITAMTSADFTIGFFTCSTGAVLAATNVGFTWEVKV
jgi:hypothetical protein